MVGGNWGQIDPVNGNVGLFVYLLDGETVDGVKRGSQYLVGDLT